MSRAQVNVISITLIVILSIVLVGTGYLWIKPLIEKKQDTLKVEKLLSDFSQENLDSLPRKIEHVAKTQAEVSFTISSDGIWTLYPENNSIEFSTFSKASNIAVGMGWVSYTPGAKCPTPSLGRVGEYPSVVCVRSDAQADGFVLTYRVVFRGLEETPTKIYKINLEKRDGTTSREKTIILKFGGTESIGNQVVTKVLILF